MARHHLVFISRAAVFTAAPPLFVLLVVVVAVAAVVVSLCARSTHGGKLWNKHRKTSSSPPSKTREAGEETSRKHLLASLSGIGAMAKMVSWSRRSPAQVGSGEEEEEAAGLTAVDDEALWRKDILMGVKCRPLEFSGHISLDCDGNGQPLSPPPPAPVGPIEKPPADIVQA